MDTTWIYALLSVNLVSLIALAGLLAIPVQPKMMNRIVFVLVSLATGAMLGNAVVHLLPESFEWVEKGKISSINVSLLILLGLGICFMMEKVLNLRCHHSGVHHHSESDCGGDEHHSGIHPTGHMSMLAHAVDNFTDGILIGSMYLVSIPTGIATTVAVVMHEIPMEFGGFGILVKAGMTKKGAILVNLASAGVAVIGTLLVLSIGSRVQALPMVLTPVGCGMVLYITAAGLIPRMQKETNAMRSLAQILIAGIGVAVMILLKMHEG